MAQSMACCTPPELQDYLANRLSPVQADRVEEHLRHCQVCEEFFKAFQRHCQNTMENRSPTLLHESKTGNEPDSHPSINFLLPPQDANELGWLSHYRVVKLLGYGGMGLVFEAEDSHLRRRVALKVILPDLAIKSTFRQRFLREAQAMAAVDHENIATIYQVGMADGANKEEIPFLAMQFLVGESLERRIITQGRITPAETIHIGKQIAAGLAAAHAHGLIHRDIKPANIFLESKERGLAKQDENALASPSQVLAAHVKILDFGLARFNDGPSNISQAGQFIGTPFFMAPEQARGENVDARSDLFSLGCVLYVMLSGKLAFDGDSTMAVLTALAVKDPAPLAELVPSAPAPLVELIHQLLAKNPAQRPPTAQIVSDLLENLGRWLVPTSIGGLTPAPGQTTWQAPLLSPSGLGIETRPPVATVPPEAPPAPTRHWLLFGVTAVCLFAVLAMGIVVFRHEHGSGDGTAAGKEPAGEPILVGILHSQTGTMRDSEMPVLDMTLLAIDELNQHGGVLGRPVKPVIRDGSSEEAIFSREAEKLIRHDKVCALFGCWTSASRKAVKEVVEAEDHLLLYPVQYEGLEQSPNIVYTGACPDQQLLPAVDWSIKKGHKKFFLVGSDYVFPRAANAILRDKIVVAGGEVVGEAYLLLGSSDVDAVVNQIVKSRPDVVLNTINGDTNVAFFRECRGRGLTPQSTPIISFSLDEAALRGLNPRHVVGHYAAWNYFQAIPGEVNDGFVNRFRQKYGEHRVVTDPMHSAWLSVQFWAQAVEEVGKTDVAAVRRAIRGQSIAAPEGADVRVDDVNQHTWKYFRLGRITANSQFEIVDAHDTPTSPNPFPTTRPRKDWEKFLTDLFKGWGNRWSNGG